MPMPLPALPHPLGTFSITSPRFPEVLIAGAGIIGLSLALELNARGAQVTVLERDTALRHASTAAAGMLAVEDPHNSPVLHSLSSFSMGLYSDFLIKIASLSGYEVQFQTTTTLQEGSEKPPEPRNHVPKPQLDKLLPKHGLANRHLYLLDEQSLDPRQLASALLSAVRRTGILLHEQTHIHELLQQHDRVIARTSSGSFQTSAFVDCRGAWSGGAVVPCKGQMLYLQPIPGFRLPFVLRTETIYVVPRTAGPNAGRVLIGATIEDVGFDVKTHQEDTLGLRDRAVALLPNLKDSEIIETWAGLRPRTPDELPVLGRVGAANTFVAAGHYRNGILLAPGTAVVMADLLEGKEPSVSLAPFAPERFIQDASHTATDIRSTIRDNRF